MTLNQNQWWSDFPRFNVAQYRKDVASVVRYLIKARSKHDPSFPDQATHKAWSMDDDNRPAAQLLDLARVSFDQVLKHFLSMDGSGGAPPDAPKEISAILEFTDSGRIQAAMLQVSLNGTVDWNDVADWSLLPQIREFLDTLPESGSGLYKIKVLPIAETPRVKLFEYGQHPQALIDHAPNKTNLTRKQHKVIHTVMIDSPAGLSETELITKSGFSDARGILKRICKKDDSWANVLSFAETSGGGYRVY